jgi:hypothetical protein
MKKYFNIAGPCIPDEHYMISSEHRCRGVAELIDQNQYFVIHAARQSGKTTLLLDLAQKLNEAGKYYALYVSLESAQGIIDPEKGIPAIISAIQKEITYNRYLPKYSLTADQYLNEFSVVLGKCLTEFCMKMDKPLVILFDEADCLSNGTLISFLRQLREGYVNRSRIPFLHSVGLIGMRNIRDYKGKIREERETLGSASPFNIVTEALTLQNFTQEEIEQLYAQHTEATGQIFSIDVIQKVYDYTQGQPWLVNAIAREIVVKMLENDPTRAVLAEHIGRAVETIIQRRDTHIDSLLERLKEERVQKIVEPVITGEDKVFSPLDDDLQYALDLGLLKKEQGRMKPSNPIYEEVIFRYLGMPVQDRMASRSYSGDDYAEGEKLNMKKLLTDFQGFWREHSEIWIERFQYKESAPHLVLMAFLQKIVNKGGQVVREMASGSGRLDVCIHFKGNLYPVELKIRYGKQTTTEGQRQLAEYMDRLGCREGWLVVFDRRKKQSWKRKLFWKTEKILGKEIHVAGC